MTREAPDPEAAGRFDFVFGETVDEAEWQQATTIEERLPLIARRFGARTEAEQHLRLAVVEQLLADEPPQVWDTAQRLTAAGADPDDALDELTVTFAQTAREGLGTRAFATDRYLARLGRLPLPDPVAIEHALLAAAATSGLTSTEALLLRVLERLGLAGDEPLVVRLVEHVADDLTEADGPLIRLPGGRVAHAARLAEGIVLTHVLTRAERDSGLVEVSFDLAGFARTRDLTYDRKPVERISSSAGHMAWRGTGGWLDRFEPGTTLAVRVDSNGAVELEGLPATPPVDQRLTAAILDVHDAAVAETRNPASAETLVFGLHVAMPTPFQQPQAPLRDLCRVAGQSPAAALARRVCRWFGQALAGEVGGAGR